MTIRFFALFFKNDLGLRPAAVNLVLTAGPVGISACGLLAQKVLPT